MFFCSSSDPMNDLCDGKREKNMMNQKMNTNYTEGSLSESP